MKSFFVLPTSLRLKDQEMILNLVHFWTVEEKLRSRNQM